MLLSASRVKVNGTSYYFTVQVRFHTFDAVAVCPGLGTACCVTVTTTRRKPYVVTVTLPFVPILLLQYRMSPRSVWPDTVHVTLVLTTPSLLVVPDVTTTTVPWRGNRLLAERAFTVRGN